MTRSQFFKHFELLADQPDAVAKMRELVFQLAVRGQLVEQSSKDEPAHKLVERARKAWTDRKIRDREKCEPQEPPHTLPTGWIWTCLDEIGDTNPRNEANDKLEVGFVPMKLISAGYGEPVSFEVKSWGEVKKGFTHFADGDVVMAKITPCFENGKSAVIPKLKNGIGAGTTELHVFRQYSGCVVPDYVLIFFKSPRFINEGVPRMTGSAGQKRVPWDYFANTPFPLPPLAEQRRIVAKVDELMALCDELEQRQQARQHARGQLQQSALHHLLAAREPQTFAAAWQRVRDHFHLLHDTPDAIPQLRQAILQLAVQGRLVPQNPKDEPASSIVERIKQDSEHGSDGKLRKIEAQEPVGDDEAPYKVPHGWVWSRAQYLVQPKEIITYGILKPVWVESGVPTVRVTEMKTGTIDVAALPKCDERRAAKFSKTRLAEGDLLISKDGTIGKTAFVPPELAGGNITQHVLRFPISKQLNSRYIQLCVEAPPCQAWMVGETKGVALKGVNVGDFRRMPMALPPLTEQKRIVARVEELLRWCDTLEAQLHQTRTLGAHLLASTLHHLLAA